MILTNSVIRFDYPTSSDVSVPLVFRPRIVRVRHVRDLVREPLTVAEYLQRPMIRRSRFLASGVDLESGRFRRFYLRSARQWLRDTPLRVGLFDGGRLAELTRSNWGPTVRDRVALAKFLGNLQREDLGGLVIGIFSDDLEVIV